MKTETTAVLGLALAVGGCAAHADLPMITASLAKAGLAETETQRRQLEHAMTDQDIANMLDVNVQAKLPTAVAVAKVTSRYDGDRPLLANIDAHELEAWEKAIRGIPRIQGVRPVTPLTATSETPALHALRTAGARMGCELLLVYLQADSTVDNPNDAAVLYWTILGLWLVPGNTMEHRTVMQAALLDCRTGMILGTATGDSHLKKDYPAAFQAQRQAELDRQAPAEALAELQQGFGKMLSAVAAAAR
jgi:rhombotail lipoprotein